MCNAATKVEEFECADHLLRALSPYSEYWRSAHSAGQSDWIFRGQEDAEWGLTPSSMRGSVVRSVEDQINSETNALNRFLNACVDAGLQIPEDGQLMRQHDLQRIAFGGELDECLQHGKSFPFKLHRSLYALAQHHGIPTRLLDWSKNPFVATYFAVREQAQRLAATLNAEPNSTSGSTKDGCAAKIAVFALNEKLLPFFRNTNDVDMYEIEVVHAPLSENPNLKAQHGCFTLVTCTGEPTHGMLPNIENVLTDYYNKPFVPKLTSQRPVILIKFTLPVAECRRVLKELFHVNVWAGTLFPGYDGVRRGIDEREFWA